MDPELRKLLMENIRLNEDNNRILRKLLRAMRWSRGIRIFYWVLLVGVTFGMFYFLQPYIERLTSAYNTLNASFTTFKEPTPGNPLFGGSRE